MAKDKLFSLRLTQALADGIDRAKTYFGGGISAGEAVRQLMERGLEQIDQESPTALWSLHERPREALMAILGKRRDHTALGRAEWAFLVERVHEAYQKSCHRCDAVSRDLLVDNFRAFNEVVRIEKLQYGKHRDSKSDDYYMGNLAIDGDDLDECVEQSIAALPAFPSPITAEYGSRNLTGILRDRRLDATHLNTHLAPYFESLLQVALRGYVLANDDSIFDDPSQPVANKRFSNLLLPEFNNAYFDFMSFGYERELGALINFRTSGLVMSLNSYVEVTEFAHMIRIVAQSDEERGAVRSDPFNITWNSRNDSGGPSYIMCYDRTRFPVSANEMAALGDLLKEVFADPDMEAHLEKLAFIYGRI